MEPEGSLPVHCSRPLVSVLTQFFAVHNFSPYFPKIHSIIIFPSILMSSKWPLTSFQSFQSKYCVHFSSLLSVLHAAPTQSSLTWSAE